MVPVSYTHLDVYKRQVYTDARLTLSKKEEYQMLRITEEAVQPFEKEHIDLVRKTAPECALLSKREDDTLPIASGKVAL